MFKYKSKLQKAADAAWERALATAGAEFNATRIEAKQVYAATGPSGRHEYEETIRQAEQDYALALKLAQDGIDGAMVGG